MPKIIFLKNPNPDVDSDKYAITAKSSCYDSCFLPILSHTFVDQPGLRTYLTDLAANADKTPVDALIITSQRAVEAVASVLLELSVSTRSYLGSLPVYTVGPATAALVQSHGFSKILGGADAGNGRILASQIVGANLRRCVFFTGETRRDIIPVTLRENGIECIERVVYTSKGIEGVEDQFMELMSDAKDVWWTVFFSPAGAESIARLIARNTEITKVAAIGPTTEEFLLKNGITPNTVSRNPDPQSLLQGINEASPTAHALA
ncbi:tetrapyrrole biosynthesis, uroporphyrinogen III synthase [Lipomyces chichibuensis]|uniref:tetrapyrrole biosynthesis, uroporphyrinogen III synthase n=1 Tax=Lipomyces chichibuensis TaxID=1546026 RepID=UPI0033431A5A